MSDPQDRLGVVLPGMPWFSKIEKEGRLVARKRQAGRQTAKILASPQTIVQIVLSTTRDSYSHSASDFTHAWVYRAIALSLG